MNDDETSVHIPVTVAIVAMISVASDSIINLYEPLNDKINSILVDKDTLIEIDIANSFFFI